MRPCLSPATTSTLSPPRRNRRRIEGLRYPDTVTPHSGIAVSRNLPVPQVTIPTTADLARNLSFSPTPACPKPLFFTKTQGTDTRCDRNRTRTKAHLLPSPREKGALPSNLTSGA
ncbi:uncharacterized protein LOC132533106 isoform X3 [Erinaceus europaeus]|uniref:Uncharacterized protein LOC132533106 isoform X3 n=1 Tax=Erinaceus europaeus TaxID=9365 RepID=A0ABM3VXI9_ERIEU|nr:uncharacterized protein LOC132533106 isoform X3 [Erinaceus europaeus]